MIQSILLTVLGGLLQEVLHWLQLRAKLDHEEFMKAAKSIWTWVLALFVLVVINPILVTVWFDHVVEPKQYLLFGAAVPLVLKSGLGASVATHAAVHLGPRSWLRRYLGFT